MREAQGTGIGMMAEIQGRKMQGNDAGVNRTEEDGQTGAIRLLYEITDLPTPLTLGLKQGRLSINQVYGHS